jgi:phosphate transport system substrate-binding protein
MHASGLIPVVALAGTIAIPHLAPAQGRYIVIDGSSTVYPIVKLAAEEFQRELDSRVTMEVSFSGTTGGFRKFLGAEVDVAGASRPISREEIRAAKEHEIPYIEIPIAYDALTIAVHPGVTWVDSIQVSELKRMWERSAEGKILTWNQIRPEWPEQELKLYGAGPDSGTYDYFLEVVVGRTEGLRSDYHGSEDDEELIRGIGQESGALGFVPHAYFSKEGDKLKALAVRWDYDAKNGRPVLGAPSTFPSEEAVFRGTYMPFGRPLFLYVRVKSLEAKPHLKEFLQFLLIHADEYVDQVHYLSLPKISYARSIADLEAKRTGTRFFGAPEVGLSVQDMINRRPR